MPSRNFAALAVDVLGNGLGAGRRLLASRAAALQLAQAAFAHESKGRRVTAAARLGNALLREPSLLRDPSLLRLGVRLAGGRRVERTLRPLKRLLR
jgi:hypothetical protein